MLVALRWWIESRRQIRRRWRADARRLVQQRLAARARPSGQAGEFVHWANVAAEVARISPCARMDIAVVQAIVDDEMRRGAAFHKQDD